ncbi:type I-F CRISPR-associated protein Csy2 [Candidatus Berkiella cookevillensis]|uniref:CRISPR-associated protein Csy2 n=1 Tax=Candidatus Berkiella cookevillensis TaxID=437022 RepID=A0A0Q9YBI1_9GAMM|nr:type I-F CRISPR-associated protein Csy2 [Candidatus Berkiella cookevillensis]MCS5709104.1 type I-F CRISPR-associated protein Csy2 [Candidatus Berkiella cookevillensis]
MSQYLVLSHIDIQNANSIAGFTWGFPAITHFLGFTHALNRKFSSHYDGEYEGELTGCAVVSHTFKNKVYQPKKHENFEFLQSKNPPVLAKHKSASPPIIEEGKMNLTISLVIELSKALSLTTQQIDELQERILSMCYRMRLAGGTILNIKQVKLLSASTKEQHITMLRKIKKLTMPGFVLLDRSDYLQAHYQALLARHKADKNILDEPQLLDAWLDFAALRYKAIPQLSKDQSEPDENTPANWEYVAKPNPGYLVPLMTGYKAISELYEAGVVLNTRDEVTPSCFVEAIHSIGEWKGMHSLNNVDEIIWRYEHDEQWYLCKQNRSTTVNEIVNPQILKTEQNQTINFNEALNLF